MSHANAEVLPEDATIEYTLLCGERTDEVPRKHRIPFDLLVPLYGKVAKEVAEGEEAAEGEGEGEGEEVAKGLPKKLPKAKTLPLPLARVSVCVACLEQEARYFITACNHLCLCTGCRMRLALSYKADRTGTSIEDLRRREDELKEKKLNRKWPCPICRCESLQMHMAKRQPKDVYRV